MLHVGRPVEPHAPERFTAQPFVCGALGPDELALWPALLAAAPVGVETKCSVEQVRFAASPAPGLERVQNSWCWGRHIGRLDRPRGVESAASDLGLAGFWRDGDTVVVHTDVFGFHDIFVREIGRTVYFANRIAPLATLGDELLSANWPAWIACFVYHSFRGSATPFHEITRLDAGERLSWIAGRTTRTQSLPGWLTSPTADASWADLVDALVEATPHHSSCPSDLTLSGGLDSRLLLACSQKPWRSYLTTWSTHNEGGWDGDVRIAREVAGLSQVHWTLVDYDIPEWQSARRQVLGRFEHTALLHTWMDPLAEVLRPRRRPLLDGLGGDVLLRYHDRVDPSNRAARNRSIWTTLGAIRFNKTTLNPELVDTWAERLLQEWLAEMSRWDDHPYGDTMKWLLTRTNRCIAINPFRLFGPERQVVTPFVDPLVVRTALATPHLPAQRPDLRPQLLGMLDHRLAELESTTDPEAEKRLYVQRGRTDPSTIAELVGDITSEPTAARFFATDLLARLNSGEPADDPTSFTLRAGAMLADWLRTWRHRLRSTDFTIA